MGAKRVSNRTVDNYLAHESYVDEVACADRGFHRNGAHHPGIRCPRTGRCGNCGSDWPCEEHAPATAEKNPKRAPRKRQKA